ncbi:transposable element Tcb2 transposase [Trichonephila clavipes]|nr:transposable element Tcb2 transposase [Trichonephila clavipes]
MDESRFNVTSYFQRPLIWRELGTRFHSSNITERDRYGGPGVIVWGGIMLNGRTELYVFDRGSVTGDGYCKELMLPRMRLFQGAIGPYSHTGQLIFGSYWKVKISLEWIGQQSLLV